MALPQVAAIDMRRDPPPRQSWLSPGLRQALAETIAPLCETIDEVDPLLTLEGLRLIHEMNT